MPAESKFGLSAARALRITLSSESSGSGEARGPRVFLASCDVVEDGRPSNQRERAAENGVQRVIKGKPPEIRALFDAVVAAIREIGPVRVLPEKTRIAFQVRMSFAQLTPRRRWLDGHVVLARRLESPRFRKIETFSPRNHLHAFRLSGLGELDDEFRAWLIEAYRVGEQKHLGNPGADA